MAKQKVSTLLDPRNILDKAGRLSITHELGSFGRAMAQAAGDKLGAELKRDWAAWDKGQTRIRAALRGWA